MCACPGGLGVGVNKRVLGVGWGAVLFVHGMVGGPFAGRRKVEAPAVAHRRGL